MGMVELVGGLLGVSCWGCGCRLRRWLGLGRMTERSGGWWWKKWLRDLFPQCFLDMPALCSVLEYSDRSVLNQPHHRTSFYLPHLENSTSSDFLQNLILF